MERQQLAEKAVETLRPFETGHLVASLQTITLKQIFSNPVILILVTVVLFLGIVRRSKTVLLTLVTLIGLIVIMRYAMPAPGEESTSMQFLGPFTVVGLGIACIIIYFSLIKPD